MVTATTTITTKLGRVRSSKGKITRAPLCLIYSLIITLYMNMDKDIIIQYTSPGLDPVSYTHLDVYKRQVHTFRRVRRYVF